MERKFYRMHDVIGGGMFETPESECANWNKLGLGIFWAVNEFNGPRQQKNLVRINSWAIDIDEGTKDDMRYKIRMGLAPSMVIETKSGFHVYFDAIDGTAETWNQVVLDRLVPFYGADKNARDLCRVLRAPGYYHLKDPANPFLIKQVYSRNVKYTVDEIFKFYKPEPKQQTPTQKTTAPFKTGDNFWDNVYALDGVYALSKLSGTKWVQHETYEFKQNANGNQNIIVNGKQSSCFVDKRGRIGSFDGAGPSVAQWLAWFGHNWKTVVQAIKETFPEVVPCSQSLTQSNQVSNDLKNKQQSL